MKTQLPIAVAAVIVVVLIATTLFYTTSTLTHISNIEVQSRRQEVWRLVDQQLNSIIISAIASSNTTAYNNFTSKWLEGMKNFDDINQTERPYERKCTPAPNEVCKTPCTRSGNNCACIWPTRYNYTGFVEGGYRTANYTGTGVKDALSRYMDILNNALQVYSIAVAKKVYASLNSWATLMRDAGLTVVVYPPTVEYYIGFEGNSTVPYSRFTNILRVNVSVDVFSVEAGYKRFNKSIEYGFNATFVRGRLIEDSFIIPVYINAYVDINGQRSLYIPDPSRIQLWVYSRMLERLGFVNLTETNGVKYAVGERYASYYYGNGTTLILFKIPLASGINAYQDAGSVASKVVNATMFVPSVDLDDTFKPPQNLNESWCRGVYNDATAAYLFAGLVSVDINGLTMFSGLKIVFKVYWDTTPSSGEDWYIIMYASLYGDEKSDFQITVPLY